MRFKAVVFASHAAQFAAKQTELLIQCLASSINLVTLRLGVKQPRLGRGQIVLQAFILVEKVPQLPLVSLRSRVMAIIESW